MRFGIVTPVLDGRDYFRACAASVAAQVEGGCPHPPNRVHTVTHYIRESSRSAAPVEDIAAEYGCDYKRAPDTGLYDAIAQGLDAAVADGADILAWLNADEQYLPDALATVTTAFQGGAKASRLAANPITRLGGTPSPYLVFGDYIIAILKTDSSTTTQSPPAPTLVGARREIPARAFYLRHGVNYIMSCATFFTRETWLKHGPFDLSYKLLADKKFYFNALENGATFKHISAWLGCYGATKNNASLSPAAPIEQARLRAEIGAYKNPSVRKAVRAMRVIEKLLRGCYSKTTLSTTLFAPDGTAREVSGTYTGRWMDK